MNLFHIFMCSLKLILYLLFSSHHLRIYRTPRHWLYAIRYVVLYIVYSKRKQKIVRNNITFIQFQTQIYTYICLYVKYYVANMSKGFFFYKKAKYKLKQVFKTTKERWTNLYTNTTSNRATSRFITKKNLKQTI